MSERIKRAGRLLSIKEREVTLAKVRVAEANAKVAEAERARQSLVDAWERAADDAARLDGVSAADHLAHRDALLTARHRIALAEREIERRRAEEAALLEALAEARANHRKLETWIDNMRAEEAEEQGRKERIMADEVAARRAAQRTS
jgi:flagellar export protein FliJ